MPIEFLDVSSAISKKPKPLDYIIPGVLRGSVGMVIGSGGIGKSFFMLQLAVSLAGGKDFLGLGVSGKKKVTYLSLEDASEIVSSRMFEIGGYLDDDDKESIKENLSIGSMFGKRLNLTNESDSNWLNDSLPKDVDLLVIDTLSRAHSGQEKDNSEMSQFISAIEGLAKKRKMAVILVHHISKSTMNDEDSISHSARGASSLTDNVRWVAALQKPSKQDGLDANQHVKFSVIKANYAQVHESVFYERDASGLLIPVGLSKAQMQEVGNKKTTKASASGKAAKTKSDIENLIESGAWITA